MTRPNIPLLRKCLEWAETEAQLENGSWDQDNWMSGIITDETVKNTTSYGSEIEYKVVEVNCGSAFCFAGNACHLEGDKFLTSSPRDILTPGRTTSNVVHVLTNEGELKVIEDRAAALLGISISDAELLFDGDNTIEDLRRIAENIAGEPL